MGTTTAYIPPSTTFCGSAPSITSFKMLVVERQFRQPYTESVQRCACMGMRVRCMRVAPPSTRGCSMLHQQQQSYCCVSTTAWCSVRWFNEQKGIIILWWCTVECVAYSFCFTLYYVLMLFPDRSSRLSILVGPRLSWIYDIDVARCTLAVRRQL